MQLGVSHEGEGSMDEREQQRKVRHRLAVLRHAEAPRPVDGRGAVARVT